MRKRYLLKFPNYRQVEFTFFARERGVGRRHFCLISWEWDGNSYWRYLWVL